MKTPDKQWSQQKDKDRNKAERDKLRKQGEQQQAHDQGGAQQGGSVETDRQPDMGRKPPGERDRDYDPDGDRIGR